MEGGGVSRDRSWSYFWERERSLRRRIRGTNEGSKWWRRRKIVNPDAQVRIDPMLALVFRLFPSIRLQLHRYVYLYLIPIESKSSVLPRIRGEKGKESETKNIHRRQNPKDSYSLPKRILAH